MKTLFLLLVISFGSTTLSARGADHTIVANRKSTYRIVVPAHASPEVSYAAGELQRFLEQMTKVKLPIVTDDQPGDAPAFMIGPTKKAVLEKLPDMAGALKEDGLIIRNIGDDIMLVGQNARGNLYAVYVLLEKFMGVRFLAHDCTVVPQVSELKLPNIHYSHASPFMYRETYYFDSFPKEIAARQRLNGPGSKCDETTGGKFEFFPFVHSFNKLVPPEEYFKDHPEYFSLAKGKRIHGDVHAQLCLSNPDVLRIAKERVMKWIVEHPEATIIDVSQNDGEGACECEQCAAIVKAEGGAQSGPILRFVNAIADDVAKAYPDKWVETLAYAYSTQPPAVTKPRGNVIIRLCHAGCYFHGFESCTLGSHHAEWIDRWRALTNRIFIWHYATNFAHYLAPNQNLEGLAKDLKFYAAHGVNGVMVQGQYQGPGGEMAELRQYLCSQLLWDPSLDPMQIREEFCRGYYETSADDVLQFLRLEDKTAGAKDVHAFGAWDPKKTVPAEFLDAALEILQRAQTKAAEPTTRNRVEKLMLPFWYMQLSYPAEYKMSDAQSKDVWASARRVILANKIDHFRETPPRNMTEWMARMDEKYGRPGKSATRPHQP
jgi:hypothetical protein